MKFANIPGHLPLIDNIRKSILNGRVPHAQMFVGASGYGVLPLVQAAIQYLMCLDIRDLDSCGVCANCRKNEKIIHPDVHWTFPVFGGNEISDHFIQTFRTKLLDNPFLSIGDWIESQDAENKLFNITSAECHQIVKKLNFQAYEADCKVHVLWMAEFLGNDGNRLLKLIEEPPADTYLFLICEDLDRVISTVTSRCQIVKVPPFHDNEIIKELVETEGLEEQQAKHIAKLAFGDIVDARKLMDRTPTDLGQLFVEWLRKSYVGNPIELTNICDSIASLNREEQKKFIQYATAWLEEMLNQKVTGQVRRLEGDELQAALKLGGLLNLHQINELCEILDHVGLAITRNANSKLLMLDTSIRIKRIFKKELAAPKPLYR